MKTLIVIPCSGWKQEGGDNCLAWEREKSAIRGLPRDAADQLLKCRRQLARQFGYPEGDDLGGSRAAPAPLRVAAAHEYRD